MEDSFRADPRHPRVLLVLLSFILIMTTSGCGVIFPLVKNQDKLSQIKLKMTTMEVEAAMGKPNEVRGSVINIDGSVVTVWQYGLYDKSDSWSAFGLGFLLATFTWWIPMSGMQHQYWLYFVDDTLIQWGRAGDWDPERIARIRMDVNLNNNK